MEDSKGAHLLSWGDPGVDLGQVPSPGQPRAAQTLLKMLMLYFGSGAESKGKGTSELRRRRKNAPGEAAF